MKSSMKFGYLCAFLLIGLVCGTYVWAGQTSSTFGVTLTVVEPKALDNPQPGEFFRKAPVATPPGLYPVLYAACSHTTEQCFYQSGKYAGTIDEIASKLPTVTSLTVVEGVVVCDRVCYNSDGWIVGSEPKS